MNIKKLLVWISALSFASVALGARLPKGTEVLLTFKEAVDSRTAKPGDKLEFAITKDVREPSGRVVLAEGTPVTGVIERVDRRDRFGKNARIRIVLNPVDGITLQPRQKGALFGGKGSTEAAAASGAGALILGPLGLAGGYFFVGKNVHVNPGDTLATEVSTVR